MKAIVPIGIGDCRLVTESKVQRPNRKQAAANNKELDRLSDVGRWTLDLGLAGQ